MGLFRRKKEEKKVVETKTEEPKIEEKSKKTTAKNVDSSKSIKTNKKEEKSNTISKKETTKEKSPTEKVEKTDKKETETKSKKPIYRVIYDKEARVWLIKKDGAKRTISSYPTKEEALNRVKDLSSSNDLNYIVHKKDGKFQKK